MKLIRLSLYCLKKMLFSISERIGLSWRHELAILFMTFGLILQILNDFSDLRAISSPALNRFLDVVKLNLFLAASYHVVSDLLERLKMYFSRH